VSRFPDQGAIQHLPLWKGRVGAFVTEVTPHSQFGKTTTSSQIWAVDFGAG